MIHESTIIMINWFSSSTTSLLNFSISGYMHSGFRIVIYCLQEKFCQVEFRLETQEELMLQFKPKVLLLAKFLLAQRRSIFVLLTTATDEMRPTQTVKDNLNWIKCYSWLSHKESACQFRRRRFRSLGWEDPLE